MSCWFCKESFSCLRPVCVTCKNRRSAAWSYAETGAKLFPVRARSGLRSSARLRRTASRRRTTFDAGFTISNSARLRASEGRLRLYHDRRCASLLRCMNSRVCNGKNRHEQHDDQQDLGEPRVPFQQKRLSFAAPLEKNRPRLSW
jgi:hypothetical protein